MTIIYTIFVLSWMFLSASSGASEFSLKSYVHEKAYPDSYTLALLDGSMVFHPLERDDVPKTIRPFIHSSTKESGSLLKTKTVPGNGGHPEYFVVELKRRKAPPPPSAVFTQALFLEASEKKADPNHVSQEDKPGVEDEDMDESDSSESADDASQGSDDDKSGLDSEEEQAEDQAKNDDNEYASSMIIFPIEKNPDQALAYLFGTWTSLLNTTAVVPSFGLKTTVSMGVASNDKDQELANIKEIVSETHHQAKPMRGSKKEQNGFGRVADFDIDDGDDGIEEVHLKPAESWGMACLEGNDFFKFRLPTKREKCFKVKPFNNGSAMYNVAKEIYRIYSTNNIHKDFLPYLDDPVTGDIIDRLNEKLQKDWKTYFNDEILYMHWTFWFRAKREQDRGGILGKIKNGGFSQKIEIGSQVYQSKQLVRSLPISLSADNFKKSNHYWFDRGKWYQISETRFKNIEKRINDVTVLQKDLFLPDFVFDSSSADYKELAYNKAAVAAMRQEKESVQDVLLLDRENISLGGGDDKFEFSDILMQKTDGKYFLIHVKRDRAHAIDHHRAQAERCALFLGQDLDRWVLPRLLMTEVIDDFYKTNVKLPKVGKIDPKTIRLKEKERGSNFKTKLLDKRKAAGVEKGHTTKKKKGNDFVKFVEDEVLRVNKEGRKFLKKIVTAPGPKSLLHRFEPYGDALGQCLDSLDDFIEYGSDKNQKVIDEEKKKEDVSPDRIKFVNNFFEQSLTVLDKHPSLTKQHQEIMPAKERSNITIVLAIIGDGSGKNKFHNQQLWGMDQTRKLITKQGFGFQVVFIKDTTPKKLEEDSGDFAEMDADSDCDISSSKEISCRSLPFDMSQDELNLAKESATKAFGGHSGFMGPSDEVMRDGGGQKYLRVKIDGSQGDCCFHALGIDREIMIERICRYIDSCENFGYSNDLAVPT